MGENAGPAVARNVGLREAKTRWVLAVDNDAVVREDTLEKLHAAATEHDAVLVQPRSVFAHDETRVHYDGGGLHYAGLIALRNFYTPLAEATGEGTLPVDCVVSVVLLAERETVLEIGGFDPRYFILFEDLDLSYRLRARGETILSVEDAIVGHRSGTEGVSFRQGPNYPSSRVFLHSRNRWVFLAKNLAGWTLFLSLPGQALYELFSFLFALANGHPLAWFKGKLAALRLLPGLRADRLTIQTTRELGDRELLVGGPLVVTPDVARGAFRAGLLRFLNGSLMLWWRIVRVLA